MGLLSKLFRLKVVCPGCLAGEARDSFSGVECGNTACSFFSRAYAWGKLRKVLARGPQRTKNPVERTFDIEYENFRGERKIIRGDLAKAYIKGSYLNLPVEPAKKRITLKADRMGNIQTVIKELSTTL